MNVVLLVLDATRTDYLGPYGGSQVPTPTLDALAEQGVTFTNCIAGAPWTPASHATMFTGQYPSGHGVRADSLEHPTDGYYLPESLADTGITTQGIGAEPWLSRRQGFDRGFDQFYDTGGHTWRHYLPLLPAGARYALAKLRCRFGTDDGTDRFDLHLFRQWVRNDDSFTFHNISVAHSPYHPPRPFRLTAGVEKTTDSRFVREQPFFEYIAGDVDPTPEEWDAVRRRYAAGIAHADYLLGRAINALDDDTWIIATADHGELLGEDGLAVHQFSLREELINVPLIIAHPSLEPTTVDDLVHHVDIAPTLHDIAAREGFAIDDPGELPGRSLLSSVDSVRKAAEVTQSTAGGTDDRVLYAEYGPPIVATNTLLNNAESVDRETVEQYFVGLQAAITAEFKLVRRGDGVKQLVRRDDESVDVSDEYPDVTQRLSTAIDRDLGPLPTVESTELDAYVEQNIKERLEHLGYA